MKSSLLRSFFAPATALFAAAVLTTTAIASMIQSWQVQSGLLDLGVKNSFSTATPHKGHLQMRIDGDAADTVNLDDLVGTTDLDWTKNNSAVTLGDKDYAAYTNDALGLSLFVQTGITLNLI